MQFLISIIALRHKTEKAKRQKEIQLICDDTKNLRLSCSVCNFYDTKLQQLSLLRGTEKNDVPTKLPIQLDFCREHNEHTGFIINRNRVARRWTVDVQSAGLLNHNSPLNLTNCCDSLLQDLG